MLSYEGTQLHSGLAQERIAKGLLPVVAHWEMLTWWHLAPVAGGALPACCVGPAGYFH